MRNSFALPIQEFHIAADFLSAAADAVVAGNHSDARSFLIKADFPEIRQFTQKICGPIDPEIHWQASMPKDAIPKSKRADLRMPGQAMELSIFSRDGWRCRFCGCRVISRKARSVFARLYPEEARWGKTFHAQTHSALGSLAASLDHILPHARGGTNDEENLVTACTPCQFGRNQWTLAEVGFADPRTRKPVIDEWDGLLRIVKIHVEEMEQCRTK